MVVTAGEGFATGFLWIGVRDAAKHPKMGKLALADKDLVAIVLRLTDPDLGVPF